jgi:isopenicillin N synthase-like dioxygenase
MSYAQAQPIAVGEIPVIDLSGLRDAGPNERRIGAEMLRAVEEVGFFYIQGHGIAQALIDDVFRISAAFFAQETERKQEVAVNAGHRGFIRMGEAVMTGGKRPDLKESFVWGLDAPGADGIPPNRWPAAMPEMRTVLTRFFEAGHGIGWGLLRAVATALDVPPDAFLRTIDRPISRGSIIYYPPQPPEMGSDQFGVSPHTDYGVLTLLYQDATGGLQVQGRDGAWLTAHPIPGSFVVNVGDLLARWSNDRFRSTPHRVVNRSGKSRYSTALFIDPNRDTLVAPLVRPGEVPRYEPVTCGDYLRSRLDATFAYRKAAAT